MSTVTSPQPLSDLFKKDAIDATLPNHQHGQNHSGKGAFFSINVDRFAFVFPQGLNMEVQKHSRLYFLPHAPKWCCGLINLRGQPVPALHLDQLFFPEHAASGAATSKKQDEWMLIIHTRQYTPVAFMLDHLPHSIGASAGNDSDDNHQGFQTQNSTSFYPPQLEKFVDGVYLGKDRKPLLLLNYDAVMASLMGLDQIGDPLTFN